ncbi:sensor histidine kinase [Microbaculum marinisediminis]|uniref:histidine kinase n=1 Tax=Microbaculum marinisediminis TaxID=2931392 RepID=A0AAW5QZV5_9HYPH|nr:HAMP domain-containing sensor histidine kinase [Microbaculum sp. A6E488]MCT8973586.1 HAMP domain-containing histidine kinase [Microbaculum sp. A6E488]
MRITYRVFLVGGIPIAIAAAIAAVAWILLNEAERARSGAVLAGATYRNLLVAMTARDEYVNATPSNRGVNAERFATFASDARANLEDLAQVARAPALREATTASGDALSHYVGSMNEFMRATIQNDRLVEEMGGRARLLISLTDEARERQRTSNAEIIQTLHDRDAAYRRIRELVNAAEELRNAIDAAELHSAMFVLADPGDIDKNMLQLGFDIGRLRNATTRLSASLASADSSAMVELQSLATAYEEAIAALLEGDRKPVISDERSLADDSKALADWSDRLLKVQTTEQRALYEEIAQLVAYSVEANETERATQNIAIEILKLGQRTAAALVERDPEATATILAESATLPQTVAALPISPLIQSEMIDAIDQWREGLGTATEVLRQQNERIADMDRSAVTMIEGARALNDLFTADAEKIGNTIRNILVFGAAAGLLFGAATAYFVARSITRPLLRLQQGMVHLAADPMAGPVADAERADELGEMARSANFFVAEIGKRELDLRRAKERADLALSELQRTQAELIQAEKLASLGQLVAGVAHEINTPVGIALTTGTQIGEEVKRFSEIAESGQIRRSQLHNFVDRMKEGAGLLFANLNRAAELVHSFKQVAADQASGERRQFDMRTWLDELMTSLGPVLRKSRHKVTFSCRDGLVLDTYPGTLGQVLTNLIMNALTHAYDDEQAGEISITVSEPSENEVRIAFADDGKGIGADDVGKVFDPFFTTGRRYGSTGLGLHIVYNLVTGTLQGKIDVESTPGKGTTFIVEIPASVADSVPDRVATVA